MEHSFENEVLTRLTKIETKLDDYSKNKEKTDDAYNLSKENEKDIADINEKIKWITRTIAGAVIAGIIGIAISLVKTGAGMPQKGVVMKQAWSDLKSFVTIAFTLTIIALVLIVAIKGNWDIFQIVFTLFSNIATAVFTYFFTRKVNIENTTEIETTNDTNQE